MAITKSARDGLGVRVSGHEDVGASVRTSAGHLKTGMGIIIKPSTMRGDAKGGLLVSETEYQEPKAEEKETYDEVILPDKEEGPAERAEPVTQAKHIEPNSAHTAPSTIPKTVRVEITIAGFGTIPSRYTHCYIGKGVIVLGLTEDSYIPVAGKQTDAGVQGVLELDKAPGRRYVFGDNSFSDSSKRKNIILVEIPPEEEE